MKLSRYQRTFLIRFSGYFISLWGVAAMLFQFGPVVSAEVGFRKDQILNVHHSVGAENGSKMISFGQITTSPVDDIRPVSTDYGIVIEKINANAKVIDDVDPGNESQYSQALAIGVAAAKGSTQPGQAGNLYIFSHSTDAPWNVARYNAIFYLLRELQNGDKVIIFYKGIRYDYLVYDKTIVDSKDLTFLTNRYDRPVLTMQTCDPPGTTLNRLIVRAKLVGS